MGTLVRFVYITQSPAYSVAESISTKTLVIGEKRGGIYDRNARPLTDDKQMLVAAVVPVMSAVEALKPYFSHQELEERLMKGNPFLCTVDQVINNKYIRTFSVTQRYQDRQTAAHILGYVNSDGNGVSGIEKAFDDYLKNTGGRLSVTFGVDALGRVLAGADKKVTDDNYYAQSGIMLTIDKKIQQITEEALGNSRIISGGALVLSTETSEILAAASVPDFNPNNISESLTAENSPFVNKLFSAYAVGSVFKPVVCAAALEQGIGPGMTFECQGSIRVGDTVFKCYEEKAHGTVDMYGALESSCNTYFINLASLLDRKELLELCKRTGLGESNILASGIEGVSGCLPSEESLKLPGNLSNFAFGQGELTATPLQIGVMYNTLITGVFREPELIRGFLSSAGELTQESYGEGETVVKKNTSSMIRLMLRSVVEKGNATNADSELLELSGKTGTAQSGVFENGREICRTWFAGFFPLQNPEFTVIIINENGTGGNSDCAPVFREICEKIYAENNLK